MHAFHTYIFAKAYTLQRGLAATADLLVKAVTENDLNFKF